MVFMETPRIIIIGCVLAILVGGASVQLRQLAQSPDASVTATHLPLGQRAKPKVASYLPPAAPRSLPSVHATPQQEFRPGDRDGPVSGASGPPTVTLGGTSQPISEHELRSRAAAVEQEANHDLQNLMGLLDLTESQQDRIFDSLVRHAPGWHPAMQAVGVVSPGDSAGKLSPIIAGTGTASIVTPGNVLDAIAAELTPDQQIELADAELDRREWWEEIIPQLLPDSDTPTIISGTGTATAVAAAPPPADDKPREAPAVLGE